MRRYSLSAPAKRDLNAILLYGIEQLGEPRARAYAEDLEERFRLLAEYSHLGRERSDLGVDVRTYPHRTHIILYRLRPDGVVRILRLRHAREEWSNDPVEDDEP